MAESDDKRWPEVERRGGEDRRSPRDRRRPHAPRDSDTVRYNPRERRQETRRSGADRRNEDEWVPVPLEGGRTPAASPESVLVAAAAEARDRAHARYSGFTVGAALETADGLIITGCNIENASYGLTLCAERVALVKALSDGCGIFTRILVLADTEQPTPPCGPCRQLLWEYCGDIEVILANTTGVTARLRLSALFPHPFDSRFIHP